MAISSLPDRAAVLWPATGRLGPGAVLRAGRALEPGDYSVVLGGISQAQIDRALAGESGMMRAGLRKIGRAVRATLFSRRR